MKAKENEKVKLFLEEKIIIFLTFLITIIIFVKLISSFGSKEIATTVEGYATYLIGWIVFFSLPYSIKKGALLNIDILYAKYPEKAKETINLLVEILLVAIMLIFTFYAYQIFIDKMKDPESTLFIVLVHLGPIIGFALSSIRSIQNMVRRGEG